MPFPPLSLFKHCIQSILKRKQEVQYQADAPEPLIFRNECKQVLGYTHYIEFQESCCINFEKGKNVIY